MKQGHYRTLPERDALVVPAPISAEALEIARALRWVPLWHHEAYIDTCRLKDFQVGWYWTLWLGCLRSPIPGYLRINDSAGASDLWKLAGAPTERCFSRSSAAVVACYQFAQIDGANYLYHPRLLAILVEQLQKLHLHKRRRFSDISTCGEQLPLLLFSVLQGGEEPQEKTGSKTAETFSDRLKRLRASRA